MLTPAPVPPTPSASDAERRAYAPLPWHCDMSGEGGPYDWGIYGDNDWPVVGEVLSEEIAKQIVRAVNAHDALVAALRAVEAEMAAGFGSSFGETREQVRRALALATTPAGER